MADATPRRPSGPVRTVENTLSPHSAPGPSRSKNDGTVVRGGVRTVESDVASYRPVATDGVETERSVRFVSNTIKL